MTPDEYFNLIKETDYITSGDEVDWAILTDKLGCVIRLLFEESTTRRDWINNFDFPIKLYKNQQHKFLVARGWGNAYKSCNDVIMQTMKETIEMYPEFKIEVLGWSYGGAMAQLAVEDINFRFGRKCNLITFGSPKPLFGHRTKKYFKSCCNEVNQYTNVCDVVCMCPPLIGYKRIRTTRVGHMDSIFQLFHPEIYHQSYDDPTLYK